MPLPGVPLYCWPFVANGRTSSSARTERGGIPSRWCAPDGSFPRDARSAAPAARTALQAQAGRRAQVWRTWAGPHSKRRKRPPARPRAGNPESTPRERPPFSPTNYDGGGSPGGMRGRGGEGGAAAGGMERTGPGVRAGGRWRSDGTALLRGWAVHHYRWEPRSHED